MRAIGLDLRTKELAGSRRTTTANASIRVTGKEIAGVLNTITTQTTTMIETMGRTTTNTEITTTTGTINSACRRARLSGRLQVAEKAPPSAPARMPAHALRMLLVQVQSTRAQVLIKRINRPSGFQVSDYATHQEID